MSSELRSRHRLLRRVAGGAYALGLRRPIREVVRPAVHQPWLSLTNRQRLFNFFNEDTVTDDEVLAEVRLPGGGAVVARLDLADEFSRNWYYWGYERYEPAVVRLLTRLAPERRVILEAGANVGYYTLLMAAAQAPGGRLHAFEPRPDVHDRLAENVRLNGWPHVRVNRMAVADRDGVATLHLPDSGNREMASLEAGFAASSHSVDVATTRLDTYWSVHADAPPDLIKIDVEGSEVKALRSLGRLLTDRWPDIVCEVLPEYEAQLNALFDSTPYGRYLISEAGLVRQDALVGSHDVRDYFLSVNPPAS